MFFVTADMSRGALGIGLLNWDVEILCWLS